MLVRHLSTRFWSCALLIGWCVAVSWYWWQALRIDHAGNVIVDLHLWADWAAHFTVGSQVAFREVWPLHNPFFITEPFFYPFLASWFSGLLVRAGLPFFAAFVIPSWLCMLALGPLVWWMVRRLLPRVSWSVVLLGTVLFFWNSGAFAASQTVREGAAFVASIVSLPTQSVVHATATAPEWYTQQEEKGVVWMLFLKNVFIPQRSMLFAVVMGLAITTLLEKAWQTHAVKAEKNTRDFAHFPLWSFAVLGVAAGFFPLLHIHSFLFLSSFWLWRYGCTPWLLERLQRNTKKSQKLQAHFWKERIVFFAPLACIGGMWFFNFYGARSPHFLSLHLGWMTADISENWSIVEFWWQNWGAVPFAAGTYIVWAVLQKKWEVVVRYAPFFGWFLLCNVVSFQPWAWDNIKILVWCALGLGACAAESAHVVMQSLHEKSKVLRYSAILLIGVFASSSLVGGARDAWSLLDTSQHKHMLYTATEMQLVEWVKSNTPVDSVWLTDTRHNHWLYNLTGRQVLLAYPGWLWSYGYPYQELESAVRAALSSTEARQQLRARIPFTHLALPIEIAASHPPTPTEAQEIARSPDWVLYAVR
jgi:hypothetical protein